MPITEENQATGNWEITLRPGTPRQVLDVLDPRTWGFAEILVTPQHIPVHALTDATCRAEAFYGGVLLAQGKNRSTISGAGLAYLLGEDDGGHIRNGADATVGPLKHAELLQSTSIVGLDTIRTNGITSGTLYDSTTTTRTIKTEAGDTRRQLLDTVCAMFGVEWRINPDGTLDTDFPGATGNLYRRGQVILSDDGDRGYGAAGSAVSLPAVMTLDNVDLRGYATDVKVDWADGVNDGLAANTVPVNWVGLEGDQIEWHTLMDWRPKNKPKDGETLAKILAWVTNSNAQATKIAEREAERRNTYRLNVAADLDETHPHRFMAVGDSVYCWAPNLSITDTGEAIQHRGQEIHPALIRITSMRTPCRGVFGYYLRYHIGSGVFGLYDFSEWVDPEEGTVQLNLGSPRRFSLYAPTGQRASAAKLKKQAAAIQRGARNGRGPAAGMSDR